MKVAILCAAVLLSAGACKKGSGSSWLVGESGLMVKVGEDGTASNYDLDSKVNLNGIACRYDGEAWVVGDDATLLYTSNAGRTWSAQTLPTTAHLRAVGTQDWGPVFVAGDGVFLSSSDTGAHWTSVSDGTVSFRSIAAAQDADVVLAVSDDGTLWSYENAALVKRGTFAGARAVAVSADGQTAVLAGDNMIARSSDAGRTWSSLTGGENVRYDAVRIDAVNQAIAVGSGGSVAHVATDGSVIMQHIGTADLRAIHIATHGDDYEAIGYVGGADGSVRITGDNGWTWRDGPNVGRAVLGVDQIGSGHN